MCENPFDLYAVFVTRMRVADVLNYRNAAVMYAVYARVSLLYTKKIFNS